AGGLHGGVAGDDRVLDVDAVGVRGPVHAAAPVGGEVLGDRAVEDGPPRRIDPAAGAEAAEAGHVAADGAVGQAHVGGAEAAPVELGRVAAAGAADQRARTRRGDAAARARADVAADRALLQERHGGDHAAAVAGAGVGAGAAGDIAADRAPGQAGVV